MILNSLKELKDYDHIFLVEDLLLFKTFFKTNKKNFNSKKILVLLSPDIELKTKKNILVNFDLKIKIFSWSLINKDYPSRWLPHKLSYEILEECKNKIYDSNLFKFRLMELLYKDKKIQLALKKIIILEIKNILSIKKIFSILHKENKNITPIISNRFYSKFSNIIDKINIIQDNNIFKEKIKIINKKEYFENIKNLFFIFFYPLYSIFNSKKIIFKPKEKKLGIKIYNNSPGVNQGNTFSLDWIIDSKKFNNSNTIFVLEDTDRNNHVSRIKEKGYNYIYSSLRKPCQNISIAELFRSFLIRFPIGFIVALFFISSNSSLVKYFLLRSWLNYCIWKKFISSSRLDYYLTLHDFHPNHIFRNILLNQINCKSLHYKHTHSENVYNYKKKDLFSNVIFAYNYHDIEYHYSKASSEMSLSDKSSSKKIKISGPVWSSKYFAKKIFEFNEIDKKKIILGVFNTGFGGTHAVNDIESHYKFLLFLKKIILDNLDIFVIFKTKSNINVYNNFEDKKFFEIIEELKKTGRFITTPNQLMATAVINISNIVISMPFATPGMDAMIMKKKSFYVDILENYKESYFDNYSKLIAHGFQNSLNLFNYYKDLSSNDDFIIPNKKFYDQSINNNLDPIDFIKKDII